MSEEIIKVLDYIGQQLGIAIDWTAANVLPQVLDILGRYRIFSIIKCALPISMCVFVIVVLAVIWTKTIKAYAICKKDQSNNFWWSYSSHYGTIDSKESVFILSLISAIIGVAICMFFPYLIDNLLNWIFVPEIKYLELLKGYIN